MYATSMSLNPKPSNFTAANTSAASRSRFHGFFRSASDMPRYHVGRITVMTETPFFSL